MYCKHAWTIWHFPNALYMTFLINVLEGLTYIQMHHETDNPLTPEYVWLCFCLQAHASGKQCNRCKPGTFGLQPDNPDGCTQCFCFGRTTSCTQAGLTVSQIMMAPAVRTLTVEYDSNTPQFQPGTSIYPVNVQQICYVNVSVTTMFHLLRII